MLVNNKIKKNKNQAILPPNKKTQNIVGGMAVLPQKADMKIMHTSDWHIGKKTENHERLNEQSAVLDEICEIADREGVDLVLVAGDVFDTYIPSADAEELFFEKVVKLARGRSVVIISGNHDDPTRLCASAPLAAKSRVYFSDSIYSDRITEKAVDNSGGAILKESGEGYAVFEKDEESVYVGMLPYPTEARFKERASGESYAERIIFWMNKCFENNTNNLPQILVSHLFALGGVTSDGEREISLGGAKAVDKGAFPPTCYTALGHLHKRQVVSKSKNIIYSGSILQYAFDEVNIDKSVTVFDVVGGKVENLHEVKLIQGKRLAKVSSISLDAAMELLKGYKDCLVELTLKLKSPMNREENAILRAEYPNVISLKLEIEGIENNRVSGRRELSDEQLFEECYKRQYGENPDRNLTELYLSLLAEVEK